MNEPAEKLESGQVVCSWRVRPAFMALGLLVFILLFQGSRHLWEPDEGRHTAGALQMVRTGEYIDVRLHPENEHFTKPPLTYWALVLSYRVFGLNEFAGRLPNALAWWGTCLLLWRVGRRLVPGSPWLPAVVYATALLPFAAANVAPPIRC
jgi:4-amino-4-deoxy-L-arabinose transferase